MENFPTRPLPKCEKVTENTFIIHLRPALKLYPAKFYINRRRIPLPTFGASGIETPHCSVGRFRQKPPFFRQIFSKMTFCCLGGRRKLRKMYTFSHDRISVPPHPIGLAFEIPSAGCDSQGKGSRNIFPGVGSDFWGGSKKFWFFAFLLLQSFENNYDFTTVGKTGSMRTILSFTLRV
jgi:hypothetical protein